MDDHGLNPSETVMIGNDLTTDIAVAEAVGIDSILLTIPSLILVENWRIPQSSQPVIADIETLKTNFT